jgi:hypothetical protein
LRACSLSLAAASVTLSLAAVPSSAADARHPLVIELFQSQGCSSCPPANANLFAWAARDDALALNFAVARNALRNKPARDEREPSKIASHGADSPMETAQTRHHTSSNLSQSPAGRTRSPSPPSRRANGPMPRLSGTAKSIRRRRSSTVAPTSPAPTRPSFRRWLGARIAAMAAPLWRSRRDKS